MTMLKSLLLLLLVIVFTILLPFISYWANGVQVFGQWSPAINKQIVYQPITLFLTILLLLILSRAKKEAFHTYFRIGNISADIIPAPLVGIKPSAKENWSHFGRNFAIVISVVTATVIYFQLFKKSSTTIAAIISVLPFSLCFSFINAFVEESITRLGVVVALQNVVSAKTIPLVSAALFGTAHYWGNPGGLVGVLVAGFLGWLLAKSILETKGMFWAWLLHFLQDVIIFSALLTI